MFSSGLPISTKSSLWPHKKNLGNVSGLHSVGEAARHGDAGGEQAGGRGLGRRGGRGMGKKMDKEVD